MFLFMSFALLNNSFDIGSEEISREELERRVKVFNDWFHQKYPQLTYLEARISEDGIIRTYTTIPIKEDEIIFALNKIWFKIIFN